MTLAPKLPYSHQFAGGYPRVAGQPTPTDPDCLDYLSRLSAADGAGVEVGVAMAIQSFIQGCKADSAGYAGDPTRTNWDAIQASCIMCGARTLSGALVPLKGTAPTPYNFVAGDYSRSGATPGLKADGTTKYIDTNRANNADGQNDNHNAVFISEVSSTSHIMGSRNSVSGRNFMDLGGGGNILRVSARANAVVTASAAPSSMTLIGHSRSAGGTLSYRLNGATTSASSTSETPDVDSLLVYARRNQTTGAAENFSNNRLAFYSIGSALDLALLDARVTTLVSQIAAAIP